MNKEKVIKYRNICAIFIAFADFSSAVDMIVRTMDFCDAYSIGLTGGIMYDAKKLNTFVEFVCAMKTKDNKKLTIYFRDSLLKQAGIRREDLPENCVNWEGKI